MNQPKNGIGATVAEQEAVLFPEWKAARASDPCVPAQCYNVARNGEW